MHRLATLLLAGALVCGGAGCSSSKKLSTVARDCSPGPCSPETVPSTFDTGPTKSTATSVAAGSRFSTVPRASDGSTTTLPKGFTRVVADGMRGIVPIQPVRSSKAVGGATLVTYITPRAGLAFGLASATFPVGTTPDLRQQATAIVADQGGTVVDVAQTTLEGQPALDVRFSAAGNAGSVTGFARVAAKANVVVAALTITDKAEATQPADYVTMRDALRFAT